MSQAEDDSSDGARTVSLETELYIFSYSYPGAVGARQGLRMVLDRQLEQGRTTLIQQARKAKADSDKNGYPFRPHTAETEWRIAAKPPGWLSLEAEEFTYYGGAHPNTGYKSLVWSDGAKKAFQPVELFTSSNALNKAIRSRFCDLLDEQREEKRGEPIDRDSDALFEDCIDPAAEAVIVPLSSNGKAFDRLRLDVPPYAAGPYVEGSYQIELPVTKAVLAAVKPDYREAFAIHAPKKDAGSKAKD